jgi:peptide/nickel transport system permease protein
VASTEIHVGATWLDAADDEGDRFGAAWKAARAWRKKPLGLVGLAILTCMLVMAVGAPVIQRYDPAQSFQITNPNYNPASTDFLHGNEHDQTVLDGKAAPSAKHWLGTDEAGRDIWSRIVWGTRRALGIGITSLVVAVSVGALLGIVSGYFGGRVDTLMQRLLDAMQAFPALLILILFATAFELNVRNLVISLAIVGIPQVSRLTRSTVLALRAMPFIEAGRVIGASDVRIMFRHILPNTAAALIVVFTIGIGTVIIAEASLSFLALTPPGVSWGLMLNEGVGFINVSPWQAVFAGAAITLAVLAFNLMGDALRDVLDPRLRV